MFATALATDLWHNGDEHDLRVHFRDNDGFRSSMIRAVASGTVGQRMMFDNFLLERKQFFEDLVCKGSYRNQCKWFLLMSPATCFTYWKSSGVSWGGRKKSENLAICGDCGGHEMLKGGAQMFETPSVKKKLAVLLTSTLPGNQLTVSSQTDWENKLIWVMAGWAMLSNIL